MEFTLQLTGKNFMPIGCEKSVCFVRSKNTLGLTKEVSYFVMSILLYVIKTLSPDR